MFHSTPQPAGRDKPQPLPQRFFEDWGRMYPVVERDHVPFNATGRGLSCPRAPRPFRLYAQVGRWESMPVRVSQANG